MPARDADLVLARAHLRLGALGLARAELETMAGRDDLDDEGIRDLAEARWRTGDTSGAGEAAATYLEVAPEDILALVIAAEAQAELGRPSEARRLAGKAMSRADGSLDPVFAGMRRSSVWPAEPGFDGVPTGLLFDDLHPSPLTPGVDHDRRATDHPETANVSTPHAPFDPALPEEFNRSPGLWDDDSLAKPADAVDPGELFQQGRSALDDGRPDAAAAALLLALRSSPALAPAVLDLLSGRSEPILVVVRGDALSIVGRPAEAARAHAAAAQDVVDATPPPAAATSPAVRTGALLSTAREPAEPTEPSASSEPEAASPAADQEVS